MTEGQIRGDTVRLPELRIYRKEGGAVIAAEDPFGKAWVRSAEIVPAGDIFKLEVPTGDEQQPFLAIRMRNMGPANRRELIDALHKCPEKLILAKGFWYEVVAD